MGFGLGISITLGRLASSGQDSCSIFEIMMLLPHRSGFLVTLADIRDFSHLMDPLIGRFGLFLLRFSYFSEPSSSLQFVLLGCTCFSTFHHWGFLLLSSAFRLLCWLLLCLFEGLGPFWNPVWFLA